MRAAIQTLKKAVLSALFVPFSVLPILVLSAPGAEAATPCLGSGTGNCQVADETGGDCSDITQCDLVTKYIDPLVAFLSALVGVAVVTSIIIGGIQYSSSAGDPSKA